MVFGNQKENAVKKVGRPRGTAPPGVSRLDGAVAVIASEAKQSRAAAAAL